MAVGAPLGFEGNVTEGKVSSVQLRHFLHSVPTSPGSSGGPLVDAQGRVVGLVKGGFRNGENLNVGLRLNVLCESLISSSCPYQ